MRSGSTSRHPGDGLGSWEVRDDDSPEHPPAQVVGTRTCSLTVQANAWRPQVTAVPDWGA